MNVFSVKLIIGLQKSAFPAHVFRLFIGLNHITSQLFYKKKSMVCEAGIDLSLTFI